MDTSRTPSPPYDQYVIQPMQSTTHHVPQQRNNPPHSQFPMQYQNYEPHREQEIGQIVSLLQDDVHQTQQPSNGFWTDHNYSNVVYMDTSAPMEQQAPLPSAQVFSQEYPNPRQEYQEYTDPYVHQNGYYNQPVQQVVYQQPQQIQQPPNNTSDRNTSKEQKVIELLLEMTPNELENLRRSKNFIKAEPEVKQEPRERPSGVATKLTKQSMPDIIDMHPSSSVSPPLVSPNALSSNSGDGFSTNNGDWSDNDDFEMTSPPRKGPKTERRTAHNLIEKKYRCSINDRINQLKDMLAPDEGKLSKSATLRRAIEEVSMLRAQNAALTVENEKLQNAVRALASSSNESAESIIVSLNLRKIVILNLNLRLKSTTLRRKSKKEC